MLYHPGNRNVMGKRTLKAVMENGVYLHKLLSRNPWSELLAIEPGFFDK